MARIRASCPTCGDVELTVPQVEVRICSTTEEGEYVFDCPSCGQTVSKQAESRTLDLLAASGVQVVTWSMPVERVMEPTARPISHDDVLDFHVLLADDDEVSKQIGMLVDDPLG